MITTLVVIAKRPVAGQVKTRLVPPLTWVQAADLAAAALTDTLRVVGSVRSHRKLLAFGGPVDGWLPAGWTHCTQPAGTLDRRIGAAFRATGPGPALLVGMDTPQLRAEQLTGFDPARYDACLGPAADGGYWAIGFRDPRVAPGAIHGVPMSTEHTADDQLRRLSRLGLTVQILDELIDVDTIDDAITVAAHARASAFARALDGIMAPLGQVG